MEVYRYRTGVVSTEQEFVGEMHTFLTSYIGGWTRIEVVTDDATTKDYVWSSEGEDDRDTEIAGADPIIIRARANSNFIYQYTYGTYISSVSNTFEIYNASFTRTGSGADSFRYWMFGNKNFICYIIQDTAVDIYVGYMGLIESFYVPETDPLPIANRAQSAYYYPLDGVSTYCAMHSVTTSGLVYYKTPSLYATTFVHDVSNRSSNIFMLPTLLYCDTSAPDYECRGSFYGIYGASGSRLGNPSVVTTASGVFMSFRLYNNVAYCNVYGPIASGIGEFPGLFINGTTGFSP